LNNDKWYQQQEHGAGSMRLNILFWLYRIFGIRFTKFWVRLVARIIGASAKSAKQFSGEYRQILNEYQTANNIKPTQFSPGQHISFFADSLVDKMVAMCSGKNHIKFTVQNDADWQEFQKLIRQKHGIFLVCSHVGNIEALAAFPDNKNVKIHAFQQVSQTGIFHKFISQHSVRTNTIIHAIEDMSVGTATEMFDFLNNGDLVMMAGDRVSASNPGKTISVKILGHNCKLPVGVFKFAKAMSHPIFAVSLLNTGHEKYILIVKKLDAENVNNMATEFAEFLEKNILRAPTQWFNFYKFFDS
jgi:predicted LPLAT superfamily acyltransferase